MRPMPVAGADALPADDVIEAWDYDGVRTLAGEQAVAIVGSGLSMADTVLALVAAGHSGPLHVISRHGLLPLPHAHGGLPSFDPATLLPMHLRQRLRWVALALGLCSVSLVGRAAYVQIINSDFYQRQGPAACARAHPRAGPGGRHVGG
ncbi:hypothetical protein G6F59_014929 [Rhizopus arrhizus]|nr:hypothetical protein G6F59_014929 [Rhizopus arrhizus]